MGAGVQHPIPLRLVQPGEIAEVIDVCGDERLVASLAEKGLRKGSRVEVIVPGNPSLCRVDDSRLSLRTGEQIEVMVAIRTA
jgi:Fe2+ transport system protein FeoA